MPSIWRWASPRRIHEATGAAGSGWGPTDQLRIRDAHDHHYPLHEVAGGAHDPKDLWPRNQGLPLDALFTFGGLAAVVLAPLVAAGTVFCAAGWLLRDWSVRGRRGRLLVRLAVSVAATAWLLAPSTTALSAWFLD